MKFIYGTSAKSGGIYQIKNIKTKKVYIGATIFFVGRWQEDRKLLDDGLFHNIALQRDYTKYGHAMFECTILKTIKITDHVGNNNKTLLKALTNEVATSLGPHCYNKHPVELLKETFTLPQVVEEIPYISRYIDREKVNKKSDEVAAAVTWAKKNADKINALAHMTLEEQLENLILQNQE
jgi:hypothetical protein